MEFNIGKKKITISKKTVVRGAITLTAGTGAYIIVRHAIKGNVNSESLNRLGKTVVAVGTFFLANTVADKVSDYAGKFVDDCFDGYEKMTNATQEMMDEIRKQNEADKSSVE